MGFEAPTFTTKRLLVRPSAPELLNPILEFRKRNEAFLRPWSPLNPENHLTLGFQMENIREDLENEKAGRGFRFYLSPPENPDEVIGGFSFSHIIMGALRSCFLGYYLDQKWLGRGLMGEAIAPGIKFAFEVLQLHRIEANIIPRNAASIRVAEKLGFQREGLSRAYLQINGVWEDHYRYALLNPREVPFS